MTVSVLSAAKRLGHLSDWSLSNLSLQKLVYIAHMFCLGRTGGQPLVHGRFEAWDYGPVHPDLYRKARIFGADPVKNIFHEAADMAPSIQRDILDEAFRDLGGLGPGGLVNATHRPGGAWETNYVPGLRHCVIPNEDILREYRSLGG